MKLSAKREIALKRVEWFDNGDTDWTSENTKRQDAMIGLTGVLEDEAGTDAIEAFFMKTEQGKLPAKVNNLPKLRGLLWGQKKMAMHEKMWREGLQEYPPFLQAIFAYQDFHNEPDYIQDIIKKVLKQLDQ